MAKIKEEEKRKRGSKLIEHSLVNRYDRKYIEMPIFHELVVLVS